MYYGGCMLVTLYYIDAKSIHKLVAFGDPNPVTISNPILEEYIVNPLVDVDPISVPIITSLKTFLYLVGDSQ